MCYKYVTRQEICDLGNTLITAEHHHNMRLGSWTANFLTLLNTRIILTHPVLPNLSAGTSSQPQLPQSQSQLQPPAPSTPDLEMGGAHDTPCAALETKHSLAWEKIIISFCLTSATEVATASIQKGNHLTPAYCLYLAVVILAFTFLFVSKYINSNTKHLTISHALQHISTFFVATAFFVAMTVPFPFWLKWGAWAIYAVAILAILACRFS